MLTAISAGESATDMPWHTGQRSSADRSRLRSCCAQHRRPCGGRRTAGVGTFNWRSSSARIIGGTTFRRLACSCSVEIGPLVLADDHAVRVEEERLRHAADAVRDGGLAVVVDRPSDSGAALPQEAEDLLFVVLEDHAEELHAVAAACARWRRAPDAPPSTARTRSPRS